MGRNFCVLFTEGLFQKHNQQKFSFADTLCITLLPKNFKKKTSSSTLEEDEIYLEVLH